MRAAASVTARTGRGARRLLSVCFVVFAVCGLSAAEPGGPAALPPGEFLRRAQQPLLQDAWAHMSGKLQHRGNEGKEKLPIRASMLFGRDSLRTEIVLDGAKVYGVAQVYSADEVPTVTLTLPEDDGGATLQSLGIDPEDITFSFLYWDLERELPPDSVRGQPCRILELTHPGKKQTARVWLSAHHLFPLKVWWFRDHEETAWRTLEFKDFKRKDDLWFVKEILLTGEKWKTKVTFGEVEGASVTEQAPPADLFTSPAADGASGLDAAGTAPKE